VARWFTDYVRRGGRVHHDGISPRLYSRMRREVEARARRRRAFDAGQKHAGKLFLALALLAVVLGVSHWAWEL
jgi:macrodomain Ter protein organizer (MatP/YcbG family)